MLSMCGVPAFKNISRSLYIPGIKGRRPVAFGKKLFEGFGVVAILVMYPIYSAKCKRAIVVTTAVRVPVPVTLC